MYAGGYLAYSARKRDFAGVMGHQGEDGSTVQHGQDAGTKIAQWIMVQYTNMAFCTIIGRSTYVTVSSRSTGRYPGVCSIEAFAVCCYVPRWIC
jgi:hypothetical protein